MKKKWSNPSVKNLNVCNTKEGCPAATGARHPGLIPDWDCEHYCRECGGCKLRPFLQSLCVANIIAPISTCNGHSGGGVTPPLS